MNSFDYSVMDSFVSVSHTTSESNVQNISDVMADIDGLFLRYLVSLYLLVNHIIEVSQVGNDCQV